MGYHVPVIGMQFFDDNGLVVAGGLLYTYAAGTLTPLATYQDSALTIPHANPVVLDSAGRAVIFIDAGVGYKFDLHTSADVPVWDTPEDNVQVAAPSVPATTQAVPTGTILEWTGTAAPTGYLLADGSAVSRATYSALFAICGTAFGVGNGTTTFNLPDFRGRYAIGITGATAIADTIGKTFGVISHTHTITAAADHVHGGSLGSGVTGAGGDHDHGSIGSSGAHTHTTDDGNLPTTDISVALTGSSIKVFTGAGPDHTHGIASSGAHTHTITTSGTHTHTMADAGAHSHGGATGTNNPPTLVVQKIVKT